MAILFEHKPGLVVYLTAGDPSLDATRAIAIAAIDAGADVIELGVPFSDPLADGPVIQRAMERAVARGTRLKDVLAPFFLAAPTSPDERLEAIATHSKGFVYAISRVGITGAQQSLSRDAAALVERIRRWTRLPIAVGFGISTRDRKS